MKIPSLKTIAFSMLALISNPAVTYAENKIIKFDGVDCTLYLPESDIATGRAVVICPGGGYSHLATSHEGHQWAPFFLQRGIAAAVLSYSMPHGDRNVPLADAHKALKILRDSATNWKINPADIGIMGFSAGGHFASTVATHFPDAEKPAFQILFYPVITLDPSFTHMGTHDNFLGKTPSKQLEDEWSNEKQVTATTPRAIIFHSNDDKAVPPTNSLRYYEALNREKVPASLHIYPVGGHGWGFRTKFPYHNQVLEELDAWIKSF